MVLQRPDYSLRCYSLLAILPVAVTDTSIRARLHVLTELVARKVNRFAQLLHSDPLLQKSRAILKLDALAVARCKKSDDVTIYEHYLHQVEDCIPAFLSDQLGDCAHVFNLNMAAHAYYDTVTAAGEPFDLTSH
jgi:hypothetical protein